MKLNYIIKMAFRNINRNRKRTMLSILSITLAVTFICFIKSYVTGIWSDMKKNTLFFETGDIKILNRDYLKEEKMMPLDLNIYGFEKSYTEVVDLVKNIKGVKYVVPRTKFGAILNRDGKMKNLIGFAMDADKEKFVNPIQDKIVEGRMFKEFAPGVYEIIIGKILAQELKVKVGDKMTLMTKTAEEGLGHMTFKIVGLVSYGVSQFDKMFFYTSLSTASRFLKMENEVMEIVIFLDQSNKSRPIAKKINRLLETQPENPYQAYAWEDQNNGQYYEMFVKMQNIYNIIYIIFLILASLVIINTVMMVIYERMKEIGTIAALGMRGTAIVQLFFFEAVILSIIGSFIGTIIGGIISFLFSKTGINLAQLTGGGMSFQFSEIMYPYFGIDLLIFSFLFGIIIASVCSYIPARRAAKIEPVEAMRGVF